MILSESKIREIIKEVICESQRISTNPFVTSPFSPIQAIPKPVINLRITGVESIEQAEAKFAKQIGPVWTDYSITCEKAAGGFTCIANRVNDPVDASLSSDSENFKSLSVQ